MGRVVARRKPVLTESPAGPTLQARAILRGTLEAFLFSLVLFAAASLIISYTPVSDQLMPLFATLTGFCSVLWGGRKAAKLAGKGFVVNGALVGVIYGLVALALGALMLAEPIVGRTIARAVAAGAVGALGGMLAPRPKTGYRRK